MNHSMISSAVTMRSLQQKLDIMSNNVANFNTAGYKKKTATFEDVLTNIKQQPEGFRKEGRLTPIGLTQSWGARLGQVKIDLSSGTLSQSGLSTDLAIDGQAVFAVLNPVTDPNGAQAMEELYTREGSFQLTFRQGDNENAYLATKDGLFVSGVNGQPITVPAGYDMRVDEQGNVFAYKSSEPETDAIPVGQIKLMQVIRSNYLEEVGMNRYQVSPDVDRNLVVRDAFAAGALERGISVKQGYVEQSNVNLGDEMVELMMVQRAFQLNSRAIASSDTMMQLANNLRG
ncbi:flagellar hook-basal body protein [Paenibacillus sp. J2TS4]|uniref:flagellar hook-basal body protein n=1 Tax=Paenibacillus sp. J2TS4 TaxID=2807194 RepID=UPI001B2890F5|nr:flagellar hook-basal body protein [Paenibacillus sp. J2TS4]GIP35573.1 flagellar basal-body rod protein FlgG [Paenibacillus sp. J2TS4]